MRWKELNSRSTPCVRLPWLLYTKKPQQLIKPHEPLPISAISAIRHHHQKPAPSSLPSRRFDLRVADRARQAPSPERAKLYACVGELELRLKDPIPQEVSKVAGVEHERKQSSPTTPQAAAMIQLKVRHVAGASLSAQLTQVQPRPCSMSSTTPAPPSPNASTSLK